MKNLAKALILTLVFATATSAQTTIGSSGGSEVRTWGPDGTDFYGQTINTSTFDLLNQFSFWLGRVSPLSSTLTPSINLQAYVYAWDNTLRQATGSALFSSAVMNHSPSDASFTRFNFNTGGLTVAPGNMYMLFVAAVGGSGGVFLEASSADGYADGAFFYQNSGAPASTWSGPGFPDAADLRFEAQLSSTVPEPSTVFLLGTGLLCLGFVAWRRKEEGDLA